MSLNVDWFIALYFKLNAFIISPCFMGDLDLLLDFTTVSLTSAKCSFTKRENLEACRSFLGCSNFIESERRKMERLGAVESSEKRISNYKLTVPSAWNAPK